MLRPSIFLSLLAACGALIPIACVQDFSVFEPGPSGGAGGSSTATSGSPSSGSSASSSGSTGGNSEAETNCNDGLDNNSDGKVDCADASCTTAAKFACVDPTAGWTGPVALFEGTSATLPTCPSSFPMQVFVGHDDLSAPDHGCNTCTCETPTVTCTPANAEFFSGGNCTGVPTLTVAQSTMCTPIAVTAQRAQIPAPAASASQCNPQGGGVTMPLPVPTWGTNSVGCMAAGPGKGCEGGAGIACTPPLTAEFNRLCVFQKGAGGVCPGAFPVKRTYYDAFTDARSCSNCGCGNPSPAAACTAQTALFASGDCMGASTNLANTNACLNVNVGGNGSIQVTATPSNMPTCTASGGARTGGVAPDATTAISVCCKN
jgi:hypothetical protein